MQSKNQVPEMNGGQKGKVFIKLRERVKQTQRKILKLILVHILEDPTPEQIVQCVPWVWFYTECLYDNHLCKQTPWLYLT